MIDGTKRQAFDVSDIPEGLGPHLPGLMSMWLPERCQLRVQLLQEDLGQDQGESKLATHPRARSTAGDLDPGSDAQSPFAPSWLGG